MATTKTYNLTRALIKRFEAVRLEGTPNTRNGGQYWSAPLHFWGSYKHSHLSFRTKLPNGLSSETTLSCIVLPEDEKFVLSNTYPGNDSHIWGKLLIVEDLKNFDELQFAHWLYEHTKSFTFPNEYYALTIPYKGQVGTMGKIYYSAYDPGFRKLTYQDTEAHEYRIIEATPMPAWFLQKGEKLVPNYT